MVDLVFRQLSHRVPHIDLINKALRATAMKRRSYACFRAGPVSWADLSYSQEDSLGLAPPYRSEAVVVPLSGNIGIAE